MDENFENWEEAAPLPDAEELKKIRQSLTKRNWKIVLTSLVLAAALLLAGVSVIVPAVESLYWGPYDGEFDAGSDLKLVIQSYTELFQPGRTVNILAGDSGFASYELILTRTDTATGEKEYLNGTLTQGDLSLDYPYFDRSMEQHYLYLDDEPEEVQEIWAEDTAEVLSELPEYVQLKAVAFFPEDLTMEQVMELNFHYNYDVRNKVSLLWIAVQNGGKMPCGFSATPSYGYEMNEHYPDFGMYDVEADGSHMERHFKSLLQFSYDQVKKDKGLPVKIAEGDYYQYVLDYVEENGVMTYGCLVTGTPQGLQAMLDSGTASHIVLLDGWIDVG